MLESARTFLKKTDYAASFFLKKKLVKRLEIMVTKISLLIVYRLARVSLSLRCGGSGNLA